MVIIDTPRKGSSVAGLSNLESERDGLTAGPFAVLENSDPIDRQGGLSIPGWYGDKRDETARLSRSKRSRGYKTLDFTKLKGRDYGFEKRPMNLI